MCLCNLHWRQSGSNDNKLTLQNGVNKPLIYCFPSTVWMYFIICKTANEFQIISVSNFSNSWIRYPFKVDFNSALILTLFSKDQTDVTVLPYLLLFQLSNSLNYHEPAKCLWIRRMGLSAKWPQRLWPCMLDIFCLPLRSSLLCDMGRLTGV